MASFALARGTNTRPRPLPRVVLVGPPTIERRRPLVERAPARDIVVVGNDEGNWQDATNRLAAMCGGGRFMPCGCAKSDGCQGNCNKGNNANQGPAMNPPKGVDLTNDEDPRVFLYKSGIPWYRCVRARWVPLTITNTAAVIAGAQGSATFQPQASFKLAQLSLSSALAADFTDMRIQVGPTQNVLPGPVDGTEFDTANNQSGAGRVDSPIADPGQNIVVFYTTAAGTAAGVGRITIKGAYAGQTDAHY